MTRYNVYITGKALKELNKIDPHSRDKVLEALIVLRDYGFTGRLDIKKLRGYKNHYRIRVGRYRILFELEKPRKIIVYAILPRKEAYK
ncbi:MAG: type II toxin-antitoxin system RelE/ParE family toxin [Desulfurococcales archaeon]|nr:type II toxin-antitoxin system RelE/ParE family toxin [Desulfurococcales archaeon]